MKAGEPRGVRVDVREARRRLRGDFLLGRAVSARQGVSLEILDPMAGLGVDALALALAGHRVQLVERRPILWALARDLFERSGVPGDRYSLSLDHAERVLARGGSWDVIYLDPMFPARSKSALPGKRMQYLAEILSGDPPPADELVELAKERARSRLVLKRRLKDPPVGVPDWSLKGRSIRYDVYRGAGKAT